MAMAFFFLCPSILLRRTYCTGPDISLQHFLDLLGEDTSLHFWCQIKFWILPARDWRIGLCISDAESRFAPPPPKKKLKCLMENFNFTFESGSTNKPYPSHKTWYFKSHSMVIAFLSIFNSSLSWGVIYGQLYLITINTVFTLCKKY